MGIGLGQPVMQYLPYPSPGIIPSQTLPGANPVRQRPDGGTETHVTRPNETNGADLAAKQNQARENHLASLRSSRYNEIMSHEMAHASAAGGLAGAINIQYDENGIAFAGSVPIQLHGVNAANPENSFRLAKQAYAGATAVGGEMSAADTGVAMAAAAIMGQAQVLMNNKNKMQREQVMG